MSSVADHFNWPTPNRNDTMYLSSIRQEEMAARKTFNKEKSSNLDISDIEKAKPYYPGYQFVKKEVLSNRNDDIEGSKPRKLHPSREKVDFGLKNDDIVGAKPQYLKFITTRKPTNPLNPQYVLPKVEQKVATPPKFIRDNMDINDIEGTKASFTTRLNICRRTNYIEDIEGSKRKKDWIPQRKQQSLDVKDINFSWEFKTSRQINPLSPRYRVRDQNNEAVEYGKVDTKVEKKPPTQTPFGLKTDDIEGAQVGTSNQNVMKIPTRENFMKIQDIPGAQIGTVKKGMKTKRQVDPLWPVYIVPGHSEPIPILTRNLKADTLTKKCEPQQITSTIIKNGSMPVIVAEDSANKVEINSNDNEKQIENNQERKSCEPRISCPAVEKRRASSVIRVRDSILVGDKNRNSNDRSEYVNARRASGNIESIENTRNRTAIIFETRKALNAKDPNQNSSNTEEKRNPRPRSIAEKFDTYISK